MTRTALHRFGALLCALGVCLWLTACLLLPATAEDTRSNLTLICRSDPVTLSGMQWNLYRVGARSADGSYQLEGDFAGDPVSMELTTASEMQTAADTLENYAVLEQRQPQSTDKTDDSGSVTFGELEKGLYLLAGKMVVSGDKRYIPSPVLVEIAGKPEEMNLLAYPKFQVRKLPTSDTIQYTVRKVWKNDESQPQDRTAFIDVGLYQDGTLTDTVRLDESNGWTYHWSADALADCRILEMDVPKGYTVVYRGNETQFLMINTHNSTKASTITPESTVVTTETTTMAVTSAPATSQVTGDTTAPATSSVTGGAAVTTVRQTGNTTASSGGKLPQTGHPPRIKPGDHSPILTHPKWELRLISVPPRLLHPHDRLHPHDLPAIRSGPFARPSPFILAPAFLPRQPQILHPPNPLQIIINLPLLKPQLRLIIHHL